MKTTSCGNFSPDGREFVLTRPLLPRPWMNVLSNGNWCYVASHLGGGYSFLGNPTVGRITRWHVDGVPRDTVGKFVYVRDDETGAWWCANGYPPTRNLDEWRCHIGLGYNRIASQHDGIACEIAYFCPMPDAETAGGGDVGDPCLLWTVKLTNTSGRKRTISATNYVELAPGNWFEDTSWREFYLLFNRQQYDGGVIYTRSTQWVKFIGGWQAANAEANNIPFDYAVFLASSADVSGYEGDRYEFVGSYRDLANPQAMDTGRLRNAVADGRDACEALQHRFEIGSGRSAEYVLILGAIDREADDAGALIEKYGTVEKARTAFANNQAYWRKVVSTPLIETDDDDLNHLVNYWLKYQGGNLSWWNRNTGYCYSGIYNFGVRDACQDAVSRLPQDPQWVRQHIARRIMIWQFEDGDYAHGGNFLSMEGTRTFHSDDPINPAFILAAYVRETGDYSILKEETPWVDARTCISGASKRPDATVYEHVVAGLDFFFSQFSERGLPLILKADWNDALDQMGNARRGESAMLACWAVYCIERFYTCMEHMNDEAKLADYRKRVAELKNAVNEIAWDGDWYWRATHDSGWVLGSKESEYGGIWSNVNSFAIVSGVADEHRTKRVLASFDEHLDHDLGSYTFYPPFGRPDPRCGIISRFQPGTKENGSLFGHSSRWRIWAECCAGRGDKAYDILHRMLPTTRHEADPDLYRIEPYVACQFIYAPESGRAGEGSHSWATGTACWTLLNVWEHILGVRPEVDGLRIDPCLPSHWTKAKMTRNYRGATYEIEITKPKGICKGAVTLTLDGETLADNLIPPQNDGKTHKAKASIC
jgi:cellobiose phosphorylase